MHSLFVGRWQPIHKGHKTLIEKVLDEGKPVLIAIRETEVSEQDPYTVEEREVMIRKEFAEYGDRVKIVAIPDIAEICYGRKVGYKIRELTLEDSVEDISATKIRDSQKRVVWFTGNVGSGKSELAHLLKERLNGIILEGNAMRESISLGASFSKEDREEHNLRVARLAKVLNNQGHNVVVSVIAPFQDAREKITQICNPYWIYVSGGEVGEDKPYEPPESPDVVIEPSEESLLESMDKIIKEVGNLEKEKPKEEEQNE